MSLLNEYERNAGDERNTYRFITRTDPTPAALKEKTLEKMRGRRRENEQKAALRRKKWLRVSAAAAVLAGVVAVTPLRGYVVSAASGVCRMISSWREDVFPVDVKQSDNGCTVEIIESRVANDFLYLTVKEYYPKEFYGGEVWRSLDWLASDKRCSFDVSSKANLNMSLMGLYDSQIEGGKNYHEATLGRKRANATYADAYAADKSRLLELFMNLHPLLENPQLSPLDYLAYQIDAFKTEALNSLKSSC